VKKILFVDTVAYRPYTCKTLREEALGGSEATLLRVARGLAKEGFDVSLYQLIDSEREETTIEGIRHVNSSFADQPDIVIHMRTSKVLPDFKQVWPNARHIVWMHDLGGDWLKDEPLDGVEVVCVSKFHGQQFLDAAMDCTLLPKVSFIPNPVEVDGMRYDRVPGRLGFFSSPHKGFSQVIALFAEARGKNPNLELVVGNPGYMDNQVTGMEGVTFLGQLPHCRALEEMSKCEVLFYPQTVFPETFGLVLAEANAMGVPVLAHDFGAAKEVLHDHNRLSNVVVDCTVLENISDGLREILNNYIRPELDSRFKLENVIAEWRRLLEERNEASSLSQEAQS
jgi:glycosyltransferase involved in cell wall biosynthesis